MANFEEQCRVHLALSPGKFYQSGLVRLLQRHPSCNTTPHAKVGRVALVWLPQATRQLQWVVHLPAQAE